jgi:SpoVK/Ycf46/Vps4 family AAA+-type ATPase
MERSKLFHVEVAVQPLSSLLTLKQQWQDYLHNLSIQLPMKDGREINLSRLFAADYDFEKTCVKACVINDDSAEAISEFRPGDAFVVHTFVLSKEEVCTEELEPAGGDDEWVSGSDSLSLPHESLDNLWENLIYDVNLKRQLLDYAQSSLLFSDKQVSSNIVNFNRIILLHGLPGTGKTSLCRALAHKLAIRLNSRFPRSTMLEINSHALFSKWFSTSGKLVSSLFQMVKDMVTDDPNALICVLIDEVESLASSRDNSSSGDPSDAMRAVNSLLTSLDKLRSFPNVLIMTTTNLHLTGSVDAAFVDRCDLLIHVEMPTFKARFEILLSCIQELQRVGIIFDYDAPLCSFKEAENNESSKQLLTCAKHAGGLSGRSLRRLPLQAHARYLTPTKPVSTRDFLEALTKTILDEQKARSQMKE